MIVFNERVRTCKNCRKTEMDIFKSTPIGKLLNYMFVAS